MHISILLKNVYRRLNSWKFPSMQKIVYLFLFCKIMRIGTFKNIFETVVPVKKRCRRIMKYLRPRRNIGPWSNTSIQIHPQSFSKVYDKVTSKLKILNEQLLINIADINVHASNETMCKEQALVLFKPELLNPYSDHLHISVEHPDHKNLQNHAVHKNYNHQWAVSPN